MKLKLYHDDFRESPRRSESSEKVVRYWFDGRIVYDVETAVTEDDCLGIIAERIILRRSLGIDGGEKKNIPYVLDAKPFGEDGPKCAELLLFDVFVAMAFVPLTPPDSRGRPILARLYCVSGLSKRYTPSSLHAGIIPDGDRCSWFLTGLPDEKLDAAIDGRSWLLAAELLRQVVTKRDVATARNLATKFIVTGDVQNGLITKIEMGRKDELALRHAYRDLKWIIPKENDMDNVPKRKIEKPATLDEAYELIESMQSVATKSMFKAIRRADIDEVKVQYEKNGADIYAREKGIDVSPWGATNLMPIQVVEEEIEKEISKIRVAVNPAGGKGESHATVQGTRMGRLMAIKGWLQARGADCSLMFYMLAKTGDAKIVSRVADIYPINAVDGNGLTAVDWAINLGDRDSAMLLHACGGNCNPYYDQNRELSKALKEFCDCDPFPRIVEVKSIVPIIVNAIDSGLDPQTVVRLENFRTETTDSDDECYRICTLFGAAVMYANYDVMRACLCNGVDANAKLDYWQTFNNGIEDVKESGRPMEIIGSKSALPLEEKNLLLKLLKDYGATPA